MVDNQNTAHTIFISFVSYLAVTLLVLTLPANAQDFRRRGYDERYQDYSERSPRSQVREKAVDVARSAIGELSREGFLALFNPTPTTFNFTYLYSPDREADSGNGSKFTSQHFRGDMNVPLPISRDMLMNVGATYMVRDFDLDSPRSTSAASKNPLYLHQVEARPGLSYFFNNNLMVVGQVRVGLFGNLDEDISEHNLQVNGDALLVYRWKPRLQVLAGALVSEDFDNARVLPQLGFRYLSESRKWHWLVTLPTQAQLQYRFSDKMKAYGGVTISGAQYHYVNDKEQDFDIQVRDTKLGGGLLFNIGEHVVFGPEGGVLIGKEALKFKLRGAEYEGDLKDSAYVQGRLGVKF